jgi:hypothetical protein
MIRDGFPSPNVSKFQKLEARSTKFETNPNDQIPMTETKIAPSGFDHSPFGILDSFRASDFGFRLSDFCNRRVRRASRLSHPPFVGQFVGPAQVVSGTSASRRAVFSIAAVNGSLFNPALIAPLRLRQRAIERPRHEAAGRHRLWQRSP